MSHHKEAHSCSTSEAAVRSLRILMTGYQLWGDHSATEIHALAAIVRVPREELIAVIDELAAEGLVRIEARQKVTLTNAGARALDLYPESLMM
ncbi:MAG TPA: hypothetical protein VEB21_10625 [Terriglobales bacterium]|nr:hypothetical protein [Terriglobales bacterium]